MITILPDRPFVHRTPPADDAWRIVQAARLVPKKGLATALRAARAERSARKESDGLRIRMGVADVS